MGGMKDKRQQPGKGREEQESMEHVGPDPVHPGSGQRLRGRSPEDITPRREEGMTRGRGGDEMRDEEL